MSTAIRATAEDIGKDWIWLYQQLPFDPPRDYKERERDIERTYSYIARINQCNDEFNFIQAC